MIAFEVSYYVWALYVFSIIGASSERGCFHSGCCMTFYLPHCTLTDLNQKLATLTRFLKHSAFRGWRGEGDEWAAETPPLHPSMGRPSPYWNKVGGCPSPLPAECLRNPIGLADKSVRFENACCRSTEEDRSRDWSVWGVPSQVLAKEMALVPKPLQSPRWGTVS